MRTTIDLPEGLLRQAKAHAALRGMKLKDFVTESVRAALHGEQVAAQQPSADSESDRATQVLSENCVFPLIRGECGPALRDLTSDKLYQLLDDEDVEREFDSRRR